MIKVTVNQPEKEEPERKYPCLGIYPSGSIVLFSDLNTGVCLHSERLGDKAGDYNDSWGDHWQPFTGSITLSNE